MSAVSALGIECRRCGRDEWYHNTRGHRVCAPCQRARVRRRKRQQTPAARLHRFARDRAKAHGVTFRLTVEDVERVYTKRCPVFRWRWGPGPRAPTLDRLRPELGYVPGNIAVISMRANQIKSNARARDVEKVAQWMKQQGL